MSKQVSTRTVTLQHIMGSAAFKEGILDYFHKKPFKDNWKGSKRYDVFDQQWCYERGRLFCLYLLDKGLTEMVIKDGRKVTHEAKLAYHDAKAQGYII